MSIRVFKPSPIIAGYQAKRIDKLSRVSQENDFPTIPKNAALVVIDMQKGFDNPLWGNRNNPDLNNNVEALLKAWRDTGRPVVHVQHCSIEPNSVLRSELESCNFYDFAKPQDGEVVFEKNVNSCFTGTNLEDYLRENKIDTLVMAGLSSDHCVSTSTRLAANLGFINYLVSDATATFDKTGTDKNKTVYSAQNIHETSLASLNNEFAFVTNTKRILELLE